MKGFYLLGIALLIASCSRSPVHKFIDTYNQEQNTYSFTVPGWLVRTGTKMALDHSEDKDHDGWKSISKHLGKMRVFTAKDNTIPPGAFKQLINDLHSADYVDYVTVRDEGKHVRVMTQEKKDKIKQLLVLVTSQDETVVAYMDADLTVEQLEAASLSFNKERKKNKKNKNTK